MKALYLKFPGLLPFLERHSAAPVLIAYVLQHHGR